MYVRPITRAAELSALAESWNALAGDVPFRRFRWLDSWWRHYGADVQIDGTAAGQGSAAASPLGNRRAELLVLCVYEGTDATSSLIGLAPWHIAPSRSQGRVIRFLGTGEVCSDHLSILSAAGREQTVAAALADWLVGPGEGSWDALELGAVVQSDTIVPLLIERLRQHGHAAHQRQGQACWRLELPGSWDEYLARLSKSHRKQVRRAVRSSFDSGRSRLVTVETASDMPAAFAQFVELHQRRRNSLGQSGCFSSPRFEAFLRSVSQRMFEAGEVRLNHLLFDGEPIAADLLLLGGRTMFAYQGGVDPNRLPLGPGGLLAMAEIRQAIEQGFEAIDFLRGNEPFKAHWRATPRLTIDYRVSAAGLASRVRHGMWLSQQRARQWARQGLLLANDMRGTNRLPGKVSRH